MVHTGSNGSNMRQGIYDIEVFYDGDCPLCRREMALLSRWDREQRIRFTNFAAPDFNATALGASRAALMAEIHGLLPDGTWLRGVEVFRRLYGAVGWRRLVAASRWPIVGQLLDWAYGLFARNRLRLTGRCTAKSCPRTAP